MSKIDIEKLIEDYKVLKSSRKVGILHNCDKATVIKHLKNAGCDILPTQRHLKYTLNHDYFKNMTPQAFYILGWLLSDGYNDTSKNLIVLSIQKSDRSVLEFIKKELNYTGKIYEYENLNRVTLSICSKTISEDICKLGCINNKSKILSFDNIEVGLDMFPFLLRGIFEGDGSIFQSNKIKSQKTISICGNRNFIKPIQDILIQNFGFSKTILSKDKRNVNMDFVSMIYSGKNNVTKFFNLVYGDNPKFFLERKYFKFLKILNE